MDRDQAVLVCLRVDSALAEHVLPTSTITHCHQCLTDVWIAPSGIELVAEDPTGTRVLCTPCALRLFETDPPDEVLAPPGAWEELRRMGFNPNDAARARLLQMAAERAKSEGKRGQSRPSE